MPCIPFKQGDSHGILCIGNEPVEINHIPKSYLFEWTEACGWLAVNKDGSERLSKVPDAVWDKVSKLPKPGEVK